MKGKDIDNKKNDVSDTSLQTSIVGGAFRKLSVAEPTAKSPKSPESSSSNNNLLQLERTASLASAGGIPYSLSMFSSIDEDEASHCKQQAKSVFRNQMPHLDAGHEITNNTNRCRSLTDMRAIRRASPVGRPVKYEPNHPQYSVNDSTSDNVLHLTRLKSRSREERDEHYHHHHNSMGEGIINSFHHHSIEEEHHYIPREAGVEVVASPDRVDESREVVFKPIVLDRDWDENQREG
mmetsp:Transcript_20890/g.29490  ORF Transcript_20890/g.29490 Transcript_20890/m.29490 type:complete len:236 (+) Transcript_20890:68-775(+)